MDVVINLRSSTKTSFGGHSFTVLGKPIYEVFFAELMKYPLGTVYLVISDEKDIIYSNIVQKFGHKIKFEPIVSTKLTDASLLKRLVLNTKISESFLYFSQISFISINLQDFIDYHKYNDSFFTIFLSKQPRSYTPYGYIYINGKRQIEGFNYKYLTDTNAVPYINSGIYAISKRAINEIKNTNNNISLTEDLLKHIVLKKKRSFVYITNGYYNLLDSLEEYYNAHTDLISGFCENPLFKIEKTGDFIPSNLTVGRNFSYQSPIMISDRAKIGNNVTIINSIIAGNVEILDDVVIENCFIGEGSRIESKSVVKNSLIWNQFLPQGTYMDDSVSDQNR